MIPKRIISIWLCDDPTQPELVKKCLPTHEIPGYEHTIIDLNNCYRNKYVTECLEAKKWAKAADYLRIYYLYTLGGVYLDADCEVLPGKTFDDLLDQQLFCGEEKNKFVSNAIIGAVPGHPALKDYLDKVDTNFIGSGDLVYQPGMYLWTEIIRNLSQKYATIYAPHVFLPYDWQTNVMERTEETRTIHYFNRSWL